MLKLGLVEMAESAKELTNERNNAMIDTKSELDQTDKETLLYEVSDEILESVASTENAALENLTMLCTGSFHTFC